MIESPKFFISTRVFYHIIESHDEEGNMSSGDPNADIEEISFNDIELQPDVQPDVPPVETEEPPVTEDSSPTASFIGEEDNPNLFIQLGDDVIIESTTYGRTIGTVYYRSLEMIHVKPDGVSNDVHRFEVNQTEDGEERFNEADGVSAVYILKKRDVESFVEQQDIRVNHIIDTFDQDRRPYKTYKIITVDKENDKITIQDPDEENSEELVFDFIGIPADKHLEFVVMRIRPMVFSDEPSEPEMEDAQPIVEQEEEDVADLEDLGIEEVGEIEVVLAKVYKEAESYEQRIPDDIQRMDALNDFISSLDPSLQNDPYAMRSVRTLIETLFHLKQSTISYEKSGEIQGAKQLSATTLFDLIERAKVPLGRPVLNVSKKEYKVDEFEKKVDAKHIQFTDFKWELQQMNAKISTIVSTSIKGDSKGKIVTEWHDQRNFLSQYLSPWKNIDLDEPRWTALTDSDVFRMNPPGSSPIPGYVASHDEKSPPVFYTVPFGIERALSTTYRKGADRRKVALVDEEKASMNSYLLFPIQAAPYLGSTRSYHLATDSGRSQLTPKTMKMLLKELGEPMSIRNSDSEEKGPTSSNIVLLTTMNQSPLSEYIRGIPMSALGWGDTISTLEQYGMENTELNEDIAKVLLEKISASQAQLLSGLSRLRDAIKEIEEKKGEPNPFLDNPAFFEEVKRQPILATLLQDYEDKNTTLSSSDLGKVIHLMKHHANYFQIAAGKNALLMGKAFIDANRTNYLLQRTIERQLEDSKRNAGIRPRRNPCRHTADLVSVRRLRDDSDRFHELTKFVLRYQGARDQNWINCNICTENLICCHERLQLQAYLNPREKDTIEKEIILSFAGGQFQGNYICRNCGQTIRALDFDNNLEFDDNGKPKSGTAVLIDDAAVLEEQVDSMLEGQSNESLGVSIVPSMKEEMKLGETETIIYNIVREISERVGILLDKQGFRNVIRGAKSWIDKFPDREAYAKKQAKSKGRMADYEIASSRDIINAAAVYLLIEIQTKIPDYVVRYALKGCKSPGFEGYPLDTNETNQQGIQYIACAISSIRKKEKPWTLAYQAIPDDTVRQNGIVLSIMKIIKDIISNDIIQAQLEEKRRYLLHVFGTSAMDEEKRTKDSIFPSFLPEQIILTPEDAAKHVISKEVVEALGNERARAGLVTLWIRHAHAIAEKTAHLVRGTAFSETTCCLNPIQEPGSYWKSMGELPDLHRRTLYPHRQGQSLLTNFVPRDAQIGVTEPDRDLYYRLFLKCCFRGPRIGYSHQPGVTNQCVWCEFQFPTHPAIMDTDKEGKAALTEVTTDTAEFTELLDKIHNVNRVEAIRMREISTVKNCMDKLIDIKPVPLDNWEAVMRVTAERFMTLNHPDKTPEDFALAAGELSNLTSDARVVIERRLTSEKQHEVLERISRLSWVDFFKVLQTYFIIPFQRVFYNFSPESFKIPIEMTKDLSEQHVTEDLVPVLQREMAFITANKGIISGGEIMFAKMKLEEYLAQMSALLPFMERIRPSVIPGGANSLVYIQQAFLYGPLSMLLDSSRIPLNVGYQSAMSAMTDNSIEFLLRMINSSLNKYGREYLSYDAAEIKNMIAIREEKERVNVVREFSNLSDEARQVELINKKLGLGKWAVGGTKLIYQYNKEYYDVERQKRLDAGMEDISGHEELYDESGFRNHGDDEYEREGGYDHNQHGDDDE